MTRYAILTPQQAALGGAGQTTMQTYSPTDLGQPALPSDGSVAGCHWSNMRNTDVLAGIVIINPGTSDISAMDAYNHSTQQAKPFRFIYSGASDAGFGSPCSALSAVAVSGTADATSVLATGTTQAAGLDLSVYPDIPSDDPLGYWRAMTSFVFRDAVAKINYSDSAGSGTTTGTVPFPNVLSRAAGLGTFCSNPANPPYSSYAQQVMIGGPPAVAGNYTTVSIAPAKVYGVTYEFFTYPPPYLLVYVVGQNAPTLGSAGLQINGSNVPVSLPCIPCCCTVLGHVF